MPFICLTDNCAIAISKAAFPVAMNCPVCQQMLTEQMEESPILPEDQQLISQLPYVIAYPLRQAILEKHPWTRINLFKDTFLNYLKYLGLLAASEFFNSPIKDRGMVALFHQNLAETAFGKWNHYIREALKYLKEQNHSFFCPELLTYYEQIETGKKVKQYKGEIEYIDANGDSQLKKQEATAIGMLINFRNRYLGHGLTLDADSSTKLWEEYFPIFRSLLEQMTFAKDYPMYKREHGETYLLQSADIEIVENVQHKDLNIWIQNKAGEAMNILPFFIVPGEVALTKESKEQIFAYESYTGKTIKFFSPEGTEKQTSGKILEKLNLLLRDKQKEIPFTPENFTKEVFLRRIEEENKLLLDTLISEKKIIPGVYQHREQMEIKLREWIGARANIFFIAAEAGSGKTNLLAEIQKQYTERGYPSLLIRAGRMEKSGLKEQVAYLLNVDEATGLDKYTSIAGTQAEPTFILIDGLNEAHNAESIWLEIIEWSKMIESGSIKFVVTGRANTKSDLERYKTDEQDLNYLYGENKENEKGLGAYVFWLTPLDMNEMKGAWENYAAKEKNRYKPLFSFDDIATFDRAIYNQINNPLVLRLFLEIYNGKPLPKKGGKHLHIWQDWFNAFSESEQAFLKLLTDEVWLKGENELLLDDLLKNETLKPYLTSDLVNAPYARMKNMGWVSRYVKDMNGCVAFTVEGALLYLLGIKLQSQTPAIDLAYIQTNLSSGNKLHHSAIESFLCEQALAGDLELVTALIDTGTEQMDICIRPLLYYLKTYGVEATIDKILAEPTDNDWKALLLLNEMMGELQASTLQEKFSDFLLVLSKQRNLILNTSLLISVLPMAKAEYTVEVLSNIENRSLTIDELEEFAFFYTFNGYPQKAIKIYQNLFDFNEIKNPIKINKIAVAYQMIEENEKAKDLFLKALALSLEDSNKYASLTAMLYYNLATVDHSDDEVSLDYLKKALKIELELYGEIHKNVVDTYVALLNCYKALNDTKSTDNIIQKIIILNEKGVNNYSTNSALATHYYENEDYENAIKFYKIAYQIKIRHHGDSNIENLESLLNLSYTYYQIENYEEAICRLLIAKKIIDQNQIYSTKRLLIMSNLANNYNNLGRFDEAISLFEDLFDLIENKEIKDFSDDHDYYSALFFYAETLYNYDQYEKSIQVLKELPEQYFNKTKVLYVLSNNYYCINDYQKAIQSYNILLEKINEESEKISVYEYIAASYQFLGDFDSAITIYVTIIDLAKTLNLEEEVITAYYRIGYCFNELKMFDKAIENFKTGYEISNRSYFIKYIAYAYEKLNNKAAAFECFLDYIVRVKINESEINKDEFNEVIDSTIRLSKTLSRESELPDWISNH